MGIVAMEAVSFSDFPGRVAATLFVRGCNFRCPWCHNGSLVAGSAGSTWDRRDVLVQLEERARLLDGVCLSGGEPTLWPDLPAFCAELRRRHYAIKLDTNGSRPRVLEYLLQEGLLDAAALDFKGPFSRYGRFIGLEEAPTPAIAESMSLLAGAPIEVEWRTTVLPCWHTREDLEEMANQVANWNRTWRLQGFRPAEGCLDPDWSEKPACSDQVLEAEARHLRHRFPGLIIRLPG